ncbi:GDP-L-fucose synthase family protein [Hyphobacterium sp.]|uniref:GDP-L-fucose synthase n=1 Tax=Hyphobacterium sp. TaxID=2004662 RepID=UPI003748D57B
MAYALEGKRVWVAGHRGMVGSALVRRLERENPAEILKVTRAELDLTSQAATAAWIAQERPDAVFVPAAKVGGIYANDTYPAEFLYENLMIASNIIHSSHQVGVEKLLFLGSSCIYPKLASQPIDEGALLTGPLEPTNEWYAIAKIAGVKLCQAYRKQYGDDFISAMPTNLYGSGDNYHPENSHVIPALIRKAHQAKVDGASTMEIWGSGTPRREFLHADDCADALVFLMKAYSAPEHVNVGSGEDIQIKALAQLVMDVVGFEGDLTYDTAKPDGTPRKLMNANRIRSLGWSPSIALRDGLAHAYECFQLEQFV